VSDQYRSRFRRRPAHHLGLARLIATVWLAGLLPACATGPAPGAPRDAAGVDAIFAEWDTPDSPGCDVAVIRKGSVVYRRGYGMADLDHDIAIASAPVFHAASLAKQFTAMAILLLAADNKLSLDDEVRRHVPELPAFADPLTIRHLLHHTSGLRDQWVLLTIAGWRLSDDVVKTGDVLDLVTRMRALNFKPGDQYLYSNTGYTLAALIVERVSGQSLREFTRSKIFRPIGMSRTIFRETHGEIVKGLAYGYRKLLPDGPFEMRMPNYDLVGPTNLLTTVENLARWERNLLDGTIGGASLLQQLQTRGTLNDGTTIPYGMGFFMQRYRGVPVVEHDGRDAGYRSHFLRFPDQRFAVACLCNVASLDAQAAGLLARRVADIYLADQLGPPPAPPSSVPPVSRPEAELAARAGAYWTSRTEEVAHVLVEQASLHLDFRTARCPLIPLAGNRYRCGPWTVEFTQAADGGPGSMVLRSGTTSIPFDAMPPTATTPTNLAGYEGRYYSSEIDTFYRVRLTGAQLAIERQKYPATPLQPIFLDAFAFGRETLGLLGPGTLRYTRDGGGRVDGFLLSGERVRHFRFDKVDSPGP
jgi:CubicO group peptidase (beta-lactamase class C family)